MRLRSTLLKTTMGIMMTIKSYTDLIKILDFNDRFEYLKLQGCVSDITFGGHRWLNQYLYQTAEWKHVRREVILRDDGCDLAHSDYRIYGRVCVHHICPLTIDDIIKRRPCVFDLDNLVCCSFSTHNALHYGNDAASNLYIKMAEREPGDTCPWK